MRAARWILSAWMGLLALPGAVVCAAPPWELFEIAPPRPWRPAPPRPAAAPTGARPATPAPYSAPGPYGSPPGLMSAGKAPQAPAPQGPALQGPALQAPSPRALGMSLLPTSPAVTSPAAPSAISPPAGNPFARERGPDLHWKTVGQSQLGRPIEAATFGRGARRVLVLGPLAGDDLAGLGMVEKLAEYAAADPARVAELQLTIVRDPNPDGRARRSAANGMGVLLDRNFAASNWQKLPEAGRLPSGPRAQSEAETRALAGLLSDLQPDTVVTVVGGPACGLAWAGPAEQLARDLAEELALQAQPARELSGSWISFAGERGVACLEFSVPHGASAQRNWADCGRGLIAAVGIATPEPRKLPSADTAELMPRPGNEPMLEWRAAKPTAPANSGPLSSSTQARNAAFPRRDGPLSPLPATPQPLEGDQAAPDLQPPPTDHGLEGSADEGWRPAGPASSRRFWPADRIQRLPPVDKVGPAS